VRGAALGLACCKELFALVEGGLAILNIADEANSYGVLIGF